MATWVVTTEIVDRLAVTTTGVAEAATAAVAAMAVEVAIVVAAEAIAVATAVAAEVTAAEIADGVVRHVETRGSPHIIDRQSRETSYMLVSLGNWKHE